MLEAAVKVQSATENQPVLEFRDVKKHFTVRGGILGSGSKQTVCAVDGVTLAIERGQTLGIVGESGCGKTTLAKLALLLEYPSGGRILFRGKDVKGIGKEETRAFHSSVQAVFQDPWSSLNPRMKILDIITEPLLVSRRLSQSEMLKRAEELMSMVGLSPSYLGRFPHELSGGQRQRVAIARALSLSPDLVVLDEPVSSLDVSIRSQIMNLLKDLQERHSVAYLMIGHHLATVAYVSQRIAVMYLGKIVELLDSQDLVKSPSHPYTQGLLAASLPSHPRNRGRSAPISGEVPSPINPPPGCRFQARCPQAMDVCSSLEPPLVEVGTGLVACHLYR
jgi:oligopeptide/dipeptide ABC transporter ATP-binding protein